MADVPDLNDLVVSGVEITLEKLIDASEEITEEQRQQWQREADKKNGIQSPKKDKKLTPAEQLINNEMELEIATVLSKAEKKLTELESKKLKIEEILKKEQLREQEKTVDNLEKTGSKLSKIEQAKTIETDKIRDKIEKIAERAKAKKEANIDYGRILTERVLAENYNNGRHLLRTGRQYWHFLKTHWTQLQDDLLSQVLLMMVDDVEPPNSSSVFTKMQARMKAKAASSVDIFRVKKGPPSVVNCINGELWIDAKTGAETFKRHNPESYLLGCLDAKYNVDAKCPLWMQTLREIFQDHVDPEKTIACLQEVFGYTIQPSKNLAIWILFYGHGKNGKSLILYILTQLLGDAVLSKSIDELSSSSNNHALQDLPGKLAIIDDDQDERKSLPSGMMKKLSEKKALTCNPKTVDSFQFINTAITFMAANKFPHTSDSSEGFSRRVCAFPFRQRFTDAKVDANRKEDIAETELSGILNWALEGLQRFRAGGSKSFPYSEDMNETKEKWLTVNNQVRQFIKIRCSIDNSFSYNVHFLYQAYIRWSLKDNVKKHYRETNFSDLMIQLGYKINSINEDGKIVDYFTGITLLQE